MAVGSSEYQVKYCGMGGEETKGKTSGGNNSDNGLILCTKSYVVQPVGGRVQSKWNQQAQDRVNSMHQEAGTGSGSVNTTQYDDTFGITGFEKQRSKSSQDSMMHAQWMDRRWLPPGWEPNPRSSSALPVTHRYSRYMYMMPTGNPC